MFTPKGVRMRPRRLLRASVVFGLAGVTALIGAVPAQSALPRSASVADIPVSFSVVNSNRSQVVCPSDSRSYTVRGELIGTSSALSSGRVASVTLYLHNLGWTRAYWHFTAVPAYDYATEMARQGHVSVVYDLLGYGASDRPAGSEVCYGSQADVASQIVSELRSGDYTSGRGTVPRATHVVLAVQSIEALTAQPEATSFRNVDGLIVTSWADEAPTRRLLQESAQDEAFCATGGQQNGPGGPTGYAPVPLSDQDFVASYFANADQSVVAAAVAGRAMSPCGELQSAPQSIANDQLELQTLTIPVLLVYGTRDALWDQPTSGQQQQTRYSGSRDVKVQFIPGSGQALALERTAPQFRSVVSAWLCARFDRC